MTRQKSFKRLVRARMETTGERYSAARAALLAAEQPKGPREPRPPLATSDEEIRRRTGRGWEEWFDLLDEWGAAERQHRDVSRWVADQLGIEPLVWEAQAVSVSYERARGLRTVGQRADGFAVTASKTVGVPVERLYDAFVDESLRSSWLPDGELVERTATKPRSARFDWADGLTRVTVSFDAKGPERSTAALEHARLADSAEAARMKAFWRERLTALKSELEGVRSMPEVNVLAVLAATIVAFLLGAAYYAVLGAQLAEVSDAAAAKRQPQPWQIAVELVRCLIVAAVVAGLAAAADIGGWTGGLLLGLTLWIGFPLVLWVGPLVHERTPWRLAAVHAGDWLAKLLVVGVIVSVWQ